MQGGDVVVVVVVHANCEEPLWDRRERHYCDPVDVTREESARARHRDE